MVVGVSNLFIGLFHGHINQYVPTHHWS